MAFRAIAQRTPFQQLSSSRYKGKHVSPQSTVDTETLSFAYISSFCEPKQSPLRLEHASTG